MAGTRTDGSDTNGISDTLHRLETVLTKRQSASARNLGSLLLEEEALLGDYVSIEGGADVEAGTVGPIIRYRGGIPGMRLEIQMPEVDYGRPGAEPDAFIISCKGFSRTAKKRISSEGNWWVRVPKDKDQRAVVEHDVLVPPEDAQVYSNDAIDVISRQVRIILQDRLLPDEES